MVKIIGVSNAKKIHSQAQTGVFWNLRCKNFNGTQRVVGNGMNRSDPHIQNQTAEKKGYRQKVEQDVMTGKLEGCAQDLVETHPLKETRPGEEVVGSPEKEVNDHYQNQRKDGDPDQSVHVIRACARLPIDGISKAGQGHHQKFRQQIAAPHAHQDKRDCYTTDDFQDSASHIDTRCGLDVRLVDSFLFTTLATFTKIYSDSHHYRASSTRHAFSSMQKNQLSVR